MRGGWHREIGIESKVDEKAETIRICSGYRQSTGVISARLIPSGTMKFTPLRTRNHPS